MLVPTTVLVVECVQVGDRGYFCGDIEEGWSEYIRWYWVFGHGDIVSSQGNLVNVSLLLNTVSE